MNKFRDLIAEAVHLAVTDVTGDSGACHCDLYSVAGVILLRHVTKKHYQLQLGSLLYLADPPGNGWFQIDARDGGLERLEYHAWLGLAGESRQKDTYTYDVKELIDFSVRHFRTMTETMQQVSGAARIGDHILFVCDPTADRISWTRPDDPPSYLWTTGELPDEYRYVPDAACTLGYHERIEDNPKLIRQLGSRVLERYTKLLELQENT